MPFCEPPFVPVLPWAGRSSVPSGQERKNSLSLLDASISIHFLTQQSTTLLPTNSTSSSILWFPLNLSLASFKSFHDSLPAVTRGRKRQLWHECEKKGAQKSSWRMFVTWQKRPRAQVAAQVREFTGANSSPRGVSGHTWPCQALPQPDSQTSKK